MLLDLVGQGTAFHNWGLACLSNASRKPSQEAQCMPSKEIASCVCAGEFPLSTVAVCVVLRNDGNVGAI